MKPKRAPRTLLDYKKVLKNYLSEPFGDRLVETITRADVLSLHHSMAATRKVADYAVAVGKAAVNFGLRNDLLPAGIRNPFAGIELYGREGREFYLTDEQVSAMGDALACLEATGEVSPWAAAAIRLLMFTGARKNEILSLRWDMVASEWAELRIPTSKTGKKAITLSPPAIEVLKAIPRIKGNAHVIVGQKPGTHMVSLTSPWTSICRKAGIEGCRIHDLRHSYASFAAADGQTLLVIGKLLGHASPATTARYAHLTDSARRRANNRLGEKLA